MNWWIIIFFFIGGLQAILSELAGSAFVTVHMNWKRWLICLAFGAGELIIGAILRSIRLKDRTSEKLQALREQRKAQIKKFYQNVPPERQWEMSIIQDKKSGDDNNDVEEVYANDNDDDGKLSV